MGSKTNRKKKPIKTDESVKVKEVEEEEEAEPVIGKSEQPKSWLTL
jgi:hypothetical protein